MRQMMKTLTFSAILFLASANIYAFALPDSIGMYKDGSKTMVLYEVNAGETLYSLSKKWNVPVEDIIAANPAVKDNTISEGQIIKIPYIPRSSAGITLIKPEPAAANKPATPADGSIKHMIEPGQTLSGIAQQYKVRLSDIISWNQLPNADIRAGQTLIIYPKAEEAQVTKEEPTPRPEPSTTKIEEKPRPVPAQSAKENEYIFRERIPEKKPEPVQAKPAKEVVPAKSAAVPAERKEDAGEKPAAVRKSNGSIEHTVQPGETLYALSKKYAIKVTDIVEWNQLTNLEIRTGQVLVIYPQEKAHLKIGLEAPEQPEREPDHIMFEDSDLIASADDDMQESARQKERVREPKAPKPAKEYQPEENLVSLRYKQDASSTYYKETSTNGVAVWIKDASPAASKNGYFALHKDLPVGTVVKVKNQMNNRMIYARVIGNLPDSQENKNILIKLPESAAKELNALDEKLAVQVIYLVPAKQQ